MPKVVFVADYFAEDLIGGAELSTEALIECSPYPVVRLRSRDVDEAKIFEHGDAFWIFTNFTKLNHGLIPLIIRRLDYCIIEYDYKYCVYRSPEVHRLTENMECNCVNPFIRDFFTNSKINWFMSERQMSWYGKKIPIMQEKLCAVLSSVFSNTTLDLIKSLKKEKREKTWVVIGSDSYIKGTDQAVQYCKDIGREFRLLKNMKYEDLLAELSESVGLIYKPRGGDTCPRLVIEAKLLGLDLDLNYFVEHKDEWWFTDEMIEWTLRRNKPIFWDQVRKAMNVSAQTINV